MTKDEHRKLIQRLCKRVAKTIDCLEVSVYLNDRLDDQYNYRRIGSTLREDDAMGEDVYHKAEQSDSLTGWVLYHAEPIRIFDLKTFDQDGKYMTSLIRTSGGWKAQDEGEGLTGVRVGTG